MNNWIETNYMLNHPTARSERLAAVARLATAAGMHDAEESAWLATLGPHSDPYKRKIGEYLWGIAKSLGYVRLHTLPWCGAVTHETAIGDDETPSPALWRALRAERDRLAAIEIAADVAARVELVQTSVETDDEETRGPVALRVCLTYADGRFIEAYRAP